MRVSLNWLNDYISLQDLSLDTITECLTGLGLEVEGVELIEPWTGDVVVGHILEAKAHPDAEKLSLCQVEVGDQQPLTIVCGAPNARTGLKVAVAKVGSCLPGDFKIKASKIRGEKSFGMLCSGAELGLSADSDGIIELDESAQVATPIAELFSLKDTVIEIGLTPNRADCLGVFGIARDLAAKLGRELKRPANDYSLSSDINTQDHVRIEVENIEDCARFTALYMDHVQVTTSPLWLQRRLESAGMRPINTIVDATNYVMLETGQPIHAYDLRDISGGLIRVRRALANETLTTLDGQLRKLTMDDIVIADQKKPVGLAGVMGGENSEVKDDTTRIVIEVAHFNSSLVRKAAKRHAIHSEASHRFERGIDIHQLHEVNLRVANLIAQLCLKNPTGSENAPRIAAHLVDIGASQPTLSRIALRVPRVRQITGLATISLQDCIDYLERLGFRYLDRTEDRVVVEVPSWRLDIIRETDLIEEIARLHGYDKIPYTLPMMEIDALPENTLIEFTDQIKLCLAESGFHEVISFPFIGPQELETFRIPKDHPYAQVVELANPLVEEQRYLRTSLSQSLVKALHENRRHGLVGSRIFECARNFYEFKGYQCPEAYQNLSPLLEFGAHLQGRGREEERPVERSFIAGCLDQPFRKKTWQGTEQAAKFFHGKAVVSKLLGSFGAEPAEWISIESKLLPWLHPTASAMIFIDNIWVGYVGELHPEVAHAAGLDFRQAPILFELDIEPIWQKAKASKDYESATLRFPPVTRDIAILVDDKTHHADVIASFKQFNRRKNLKQLSLFDVYRGNKVEPGKKSMAYSLTFQSPSKTLTDKEVEKELGALLEHLRTQIAAELR